MQIKNIRSFVDGVIILILGFIHLAWFVFVGKNYTLQDLLYVIIFSAQILFGRYKILKSFVK